jgi:flagellar hook-length control protein FliK
METDAVAVTEEEVELDTKVPDEVLEVMNSLAAALLQQTAQELDLSEDELNQLLSDLHMDVSDLLKAENLLTVVVAAGGESDAMSLLTKENLYGSYQQLTGTLSNKLNDAAKALGISKDELTKFFDQAKQLMTEAETPAHIPDSQAAAAEDGPSFSMQTLHTKPVAETVSEPVAETDAEPLEFVSEEAEEPVTNQLRQDSTVSGAEEHTQAVQPRENNTQGEASGRSDGREVGRQENQTHLVGGHTDMLKAQDAVAQAQAATAQSASQDVDTESIIRQIVDYMEVNAGGDTPSLEMQLTPEHLGTLRVHLAAKDGVVSAQIIAQNETVKNALESQMIRLVESFDEQGIKVDAVEVSVGTHASPQSFDQGGGSESGSSTSDSRSGYGRRLRNLNLSALTEGQEMEEEDRLAAEMLRAEGNTVDYAV